MKKAPFVLAILFISFLITPTIIRVFQNETNCIVVSSFFDEEQGESDSKLIFLYCDNTISFNYPNAQKSKPFTLESLNHDDVSLFEIFSPPEIKFCIPS